MITTDQLGRELELLSPPKRIISLVPSQTELLYDIGLRDEVVGITKFCIHPEEWYRSKPRFGGTKTLDFDKIRSLKPDLIIGNKEENDKAQIEELMKFYPVWMSDINNFSDAVIMIIEISNMVGKAAEGAKLADKLVRKNIKPSYYSEKSAAYFIWQDPDMVAGKNTFINDRMKHCGFMNVFDKPEFDRYPIITSRQLRSESPELILLSSEPFPFKEKHVQDFINIYPQAKVQIVDGEMFSWYGSRMLKALDYFEELVRDLKTLNSK